MFERTPSRWLLLVLSLIAASGSARGSAGEGEGIPTFVDVARAAGIDFQHINGDPHRKDYIFEAKGGGAAFVDYDRDGWLDVLLVQGSTLERWKKGENPVTLALFRNQRDGTFRPVGSEAGLTRRGWGMGVTVGDYDNDGFPDLYVTQLGPNVLYRNRGDGTFQDVTARSGTGDPRWSTSAAFGDYDADGRLDLYVANYLDVGPDHLPPQSEVCTYLGEPVLCGPRGLEGARDVLYRNLGDGTFSDVSESSGAFDQEGYFGLGVVWSDLDGDRDPDLYVGNDATPNLLFVNQGEGRFEETAFLSGLAVNADGAMQASMGIDAADYDNDGLIDLYVTHFASDYSTLYRNLGGLNFRDVTQASNLQSSEWSLVSWGVRFVDLNLDGWKDLVHVNGHVYPFLDEEGAREDYRQPVTAYLNDGQGSFRDISRLAGPGFTAATVARGAAFGDYDNDGDIDLLVATMNGSPQLLRNDRRDSNHWLMVRLVGEEANRDGIGARITVTTGSIEQTWEVKTGVGIYSASDPRAHFGVGGFRKVDRLRVEWPGGETQAFEELASDRHYLLREGREIEAEKLEGN